MQAVKSLWNRAGALWLSLGVMFMAFAMPARAALEDLTDTDTDDIPDVLESLSTEIVADALILLGWAVTFVGAILGLSIAIKLFKSFANKAS